MSIKRIIVALPVVAGLVLAGSAAARMLPAETVRSDAYPSSAVQPRCEHNGVSYNKQNHPNCGLHLGWSQEEGGGSTGGDDTGEPGEDTAPAQHPSHGHHLKAAKHHGGREEHGHHGGRSHDRNDRTSGRSHGHGSGRPSDEVHGGPKHGK
jgi:hypothetical protein